MEAAPARLRIDKWLWQARFFKTRSLASKIASAGSVRVNGTRIAKASATVTLGDVLTFPQARDVRVVRIEALGERRGPATEAQALYTDLAPPEKRPSQPKTPSHPEAERTGRPTKKDRRQLSAIRPSQT